MILTVHVVQSGRCIRDHYLQGGGAGKPLRSAVRGRPCAWSADIPAEMFGPGLPASRPGRHGRGLHEAFDGGRAAVCCWSCVERTENDTRPIPEFHWLAGRELVSWEISGNFLQNFSGTFPEKLRGNLPTICDIKMSRNIARNVHNIT